MKLVAAPHPHLHPSNLHIGQAALSRDFDVEEVRERDGSAHDHVRTAADPLRLAPAMLALAVLALHLELLLRPLAAIWSRRSVTIGKPASASKGVWGANPAGRHTAARELGQGQVDEFLDDDGGTFWRGRAGARGCSGGGAT